MSTKHRNRHNKDRNKLLSKRKREINSFSERNKLFSRDLLYDFDYYNKLRHDRRRRRILREIEDKRRYMHKDLSYRRDDGRIATYHIQKPSKRALMVSRLEFDDPRRVIVCQRRSERREVLFSLNLIGKGKGGVKDHKYHWRDDSHIKC